MEAWSLETLNAFLTPCRLSFQMISIWAGGTSLCCDLWQSPQLSLTDTTFSKHVCFHRLLFLFFYLFVFRWSRLLSYLLRPPSVSSRLQLVTAWKLSFANFHSRSTHRDGWTQDNGLKGDCCCKRSDNWRLETNREKSSESTRDIIHIWIWRITEFVGVIHPSLWRRFQHVLFFHKHYKISGGIIMFESGLGGWEDFMFHCVTTDLTYRMKFRYPFFHFLY